MYMRCMYKPMHKEGERKRAWREGASKQDKICDNRGRWIKHEGFTIKVEYVGNVGVWIIEGGAGQE